MTPYNLNKTNIHLYSIFSLTGDISPAYPFTTDDRIPLGIGKHGTPTAIYPNYSGDRRIHNMTDNGYSSNSGAAALQRDSTTYMKIAV